MNMSSQGEENMRNEQVKFDINKYSKARNDNKDDHFSWCFCLLLNTSCASTKALIVQSQNIRKLNPMNSPNTPPTSNIRYKR